MARKQTYKQLQEELVESAEKSIRQRQRMMGDYSFSKVGLDENALIVDTNDTWRQAKEKVKVLQDYLNHKVKYSVRRIGGVALTYDEYQDLIDMKSRHFAERLRYSNAKRDITSYYTIKTEDGNIEYKEKERETVEQDDILSYYRSPKGKPLLKKKYFKGMTFKDKYGKEVSLEEYLKLDENKKRIVPLTFSDRVSYEQALKNLWLHGKDYSYKKAETYMENYFESLGKSVSSVLAKSIENIIRASNVTPLDFVYLLNKTDAFDISFVYSKEDVDKKVEIIASNVARFIKQRTPEEEQEFKKFVTNAYGDKAWEKYNKDNR